MKTYDVKPIKTPMVEGTPKHEEPHFPTICVPVDKDWLNKLEVGKDITVTLKGKLVEIAMNEPEKEYSRNEIRVEVHKVEMDEGGEYKELVED